MVKKMTTEQNDNAYITATYFSLFLGGLGVDRFYMGYTGLGILKLVTFGGFGIWWLIDLIWIALGNSKTRNGVLLTRTESATRLVYVGVGIFLILQIVGGILSTISYTVSIDSLDKSLNEISNSISGAVVETTSSSDDTSGEGTVKITFPEKE